MNVNNAYADLRNCQSNALIMELKTTLTKLVFANTRKTTFLKGTIIGMNFSI